MGRARADVQPERAGLSEAPASGDGDDGTRRGAYGPPSIIDWAAAPFSRGRRLRLLLIEDDEEIAAFVVEALERTGHIVERAGDGNEGLDRALAVDFDVVILDRMLPGMDGLEVLARIRGGGGGAPVIILTARDAITDRVAGLDAGADDYLVKPFAIAELEARISALGRRPRSPDRDGIVVSGSVRLDRMNRAVSRGGRPVALQPREFQLLDELMRHGGRVVTRAMLLKAVWRFDFDPQTRIIESHISRLRAKLDAGFAEGAIETLRGTGYRMRGDV